MSVEATMAGVVEALRSREEELAATMLRRFAQELPELGLDADPELAEAMRASARANLRAGFDHIASGGRPLPYGPPQDAMDEARVAAQADIGLGPGLQTYRIGQSVLFDAVLDTVDADDELDRRTRSDVLRRCTQYAFAYIDAIVPLVTDEYTRERERMVRGREARRVQLVRDLLDGQAVDAGELGYDLAGTHRAAVVWGPDAEATIARLAAALDATLLSVPATGRSCWAWLGGGRAADDRAVLAAFDGAPSDSALAFGRAASGAEGARAGHRQARAAHRIGVRTGSAVTFFDAVALEAILLTDEDAARAFVAAELAPLDGPDGSKLRETLDAYFASGFNASSAAAALAVTDRTVANRIATIERLLDRRVRERQTELQAARRLERILTP